MLNFLRLGDLSGCGGLADGVIVDSESNKEKEKNNTTPLN